MDAPKGLTVLEESPHLVMVRRWSGEKTVAGVVATVVWNGLMVAGAWAMVHYGFMSRGSLLFGLFCTPFILFPLSGVLLLYITLLRLCNYSRLTAGGEGLRVWHGPLPSAHGNVMIARAELKQVFCTARGDGAFNVMAELQSGRQIRLMAGLPDKIQAAFVEDRVEGLLGIADHAVAGEVKVPTLSPQGQAFLNGLVCPHCKHPISAAETNLRTGIATCGACGQAFSFAEGLQRAMAKPTVPQPRTVRKHYEGEDLVLDFRCFKAVYLLFVAMCLVFEGLFGSTLFGPGDAGFGIYTPIAITIIGIFLYFLLTQVLNHIIVRVNRQTLSVRYWPLPFGRALDLDARTIEQVYVQKTLQNTKHGVSYNYDLIAVLRDGRRKPLLPSFHDPDAPAALFFEQEIERQLGLADAPVVGEMALDG